MRSPLSSRTNSRPERVTPDEFFDLVASSVVMVFPSVSQLRGLNLPFVCLYLTQRRCHRELSIANLAEFLGMRRRSTYGLIRQDRSTAGISQPLGYDFCRAERGPRTAHISRAW